MKTKLIALFVISTFLVSCNTTRPTDVKKSDTQKYSRPITEQALYKTLAPQARNFCAFLHVLRTQNIDF